MDANELLKLVITKGGIIGKAGTYYVHNKELARDYIIELKAHTHLPTISKLFGKKLTKAIDDFN